MKNELPDDIDQLKAMLRKQQTQLRQYAGQVAGYELEINRLKAQLDKLRRMLFGQSSEKSRNWIGPYISIHFLSLNPLLVRRRRYSRGERYPSAL